MRVTKHLLATKNALMAEDNMFSVCKICKLNLPFGEPLFVRLARGERFFDLIVTNYSALRSINKQHLAWLQAPFGNYLRWVNINNANFARHNYAIIIGNPISTRSQSVAI